MDQKELTEAMFGNIDKKVEKSETHFVTKKIVYISMVVSLVFPIIMAVFLINTLNDIDFGESRPSCTAPFFTNPHNITGLNSTSVNSDSSFTTKAKIPGGPNIPLEPYPCEKK